LLHIKCVTTPLKECYSILGIIQPKFEASYFPKNNKSKMTQHYDIMSVNAVMLLASGYGYILTGHEPTGFFLLFLSLCNVIGIVVGRITDLENYRKQQESDMLDNDYEYDEDEDEEEEEQDVQEEPEVEEEDEEEPEHEDDEAEVEDEPPLDESDVHYCGSEECGEEITNLEGAGLCAGCGLVYYCNTECQRADWKAGHKLICDRNTSISDDSSSESVGDALPAAEPEPVAEPVAEAAPEAPVEATPEVIPEASDEAPSEPIAEATPEPPKLPVYPLKFRAPPPPPPPPSATKPVGFSV